MIQFDKVTKRYDGGREALSNVSLEIGAGELIFLTGHSGAGKSTVLKLIALIERPTRGQVLFEGRNVSRLSDRAIPRHRRQIGMVFQDHKLLEDRTVFENIALPMIIAGYSHREIRGRVRAALDHVGLLDKEKRTPTMLSTGEQQRIGIARAVVARPKLLIADEPTGNLDPETADAVFEQLMALVRGSNLAALVATHNLALAARMDRTLSLQNGKISPAS